MKAWSSALVSEISDWPDVDARSFFGFTALYRQERIFAALPRTRSINAADSFAFKLEKASPQLRARLDDDRRVGSMQMNRSQWFTFELDSGRDLHDALDWLVEAYEAARNPKK